MITFKAEHKKKKRNAQKINNLWLRERIFFGRNFLSRVFKEEFEEYYKDLIC
jgi:hypothetical protein